MQLLHKTAPGITKVLPALPQRHSFPSFARRGVIYSLFFFPLTWEIRAWSLKDTPSSARRQLMLYIGCKIKQQRPPWLRNFLACKAIGILQRHTALKICQLSSLQGASVMNARIDLKQSFFTMCVLQQRTILEQRIKETKKKENKRKTPAETEGQIMTANPKFLLRFRCQSDPQRMKGLEKWHNTSFRCSFLPCSKEFIIYYVP